MYVIPDEITARVIIFGRSSLGNDGIWVKVLLWVIWKEFSQLPFWFFGFLEISPVRMIDRRKRGQDFVLGKQR